MSSYNEVYVKRLKEHLNDLNKAIALLKRPDSHAIFKTEQIQRLTLEAAKIQEEISSYDEELSEEYLDKIDIKIKNILAELEELQELKNNYNHDEINMARIRSNEILLNEKLKKLQKKKVKREGRQKFFLIPKYNINKLKRVIRAKAETRLDNAELYLYDRERESERREEKGKGTILYDMKSDIYDYFVLGYRKDLVDFMNKGNSLPRLIGAKPVVITQRFLNFLLGKDSSEKEDEEEEQEDERKNSEDDRRNDEEKREKPDNDRRRDEQKENDPALEELLNKLKNAQKTIKNDSNIEKIEPPKVVKAEPQKQPENTISNDVPSSKELPPINEEKSLTVQEEKSLIPVEKPTEEYKAMTDEEILKAHEHINKYKMVNELDSMFEDSIEIKEEETKRR